MKCKYKRNRFGRACVVTRTGVMIGKNHPGLRVVSTTRNPKPDIDAPLRGIDFLFAALCVLLLLLWVVG